MAAQTRHGGSDLKVLEAMAGRLIHNKLLSVKDIPHLTKYQIVLSRDQFRKNPPTNIKKCEQGILEGDYALCISLFHGSELLLQMGSRSFYVYLRTIMDGSRGATRARSELSRNQDFMNLYQQLETMFAESMVSEANGSLMFNSSFGPGQKPTFVYSHPKLKKLEDVVLQHFKSWKRSGGQGEPERGPVDTRVMIFSSFRESVQEIAEMLNRHLPIVKVMTFVGQASTGNGVKGFTQKEQLEVMKRFRDGGYNTLVSTCVGEEGLDIGEVDLIVCFDAQKSPIRLVQRMGRTGRKRQGRIVVILTAGREERTYNQSQSLKRSIHKAIIGNTMLQFNLQSPRMVPEGINPKVHKMYITHGLYEAKDNPRQSSMLRKSTLFNGTICKQKDSKEDWSLTAAEMEVWNKLYRIQESDGIKDVTMPRTCFETFKDQEETTQSEGKDVRELSLSEWGPWQNRPLPTHLINHSDRCNHFIGLMEMMDLMRHEEGGCNYELEMMSYLDKEDIEIPKGARSRSGYQKERQSAENLFSSKKTKPASTTKPKLASSFIEPYDGYASLFKASHFKSTKKSLSLCSAVELDNSTCRVPTSVERMCDSAITKTNPIIDSAAAKEVVPLENTEYLHQDMEEEVCSEVSFSENMIPRKQDMVFTTELCQKRLSNSTKLLNKRTSEAFSRVNADSGYSSFTDESAVIPCTMFYPPVEEVEYCDRKNQCIHHSHSLIKSMIANVERFLSRSPPPLDELLLLEEIMSTIAEEKESNHLKNKPVPLCFGKSLEHGPILPDEHIQNEKKASPKTEMKIQSFRTAKNKVSIMCLKASALTPVKPDKPDCEVAPQEHSSLNVSRSSDYSMKNGSLETSNQLNSDVGSKYSDTDWHDIFDRESEEDTADEGSKMNSPTCNPPHTLDIREKSIEEDEDIVDLPTEESIDLFEDEPFSVSSTTSPCKSNVCSSGSIPDLPDKDKRLALNIYTAPTEHKEEIEASVLHPESKTCIPPEGKESINKIDTFDCSEELFSVNFDLGFSIEESEDDDPPLSTDVLNESAIEKAEGISYSPLEDLHIQSVSLVGNCSITPLSNYKKESIIEEKRSTPVTSSRPIRFVKSKQRSTFSPLNSTKDKDYTSPIHFAPTNSFFTPLGEKWNSGGFCERTPERFTSDLAARAQLTPFAKRSKENAESVKKKLLNSEPVRTLLTGTTGNSAGLEISVNPDFSHKGSDSESEDEVFLCKKRKKTATNVLNTPEVTNRHFEFDSPVHPVKKRRNILDTLELCDDEPDFKSIASNGVENQNVKSTKHPTDIKTKKSSHLLKQKHAAQQFMDVEAELSSEGADDVSSDETFDSADEEDCSLMEFLNDNTELSQALNDSEMHGIYMKSVRSPMLGNRFKLANRRARNNDMIFSQIPEQDETYMEDSFCVQEDNEEACWSKMESSDEEDAAIINFDLLNQDSFIGGRKQYCTRRRARIKLARSVQISEIQIQKKKGSRIIVPEDSSEEETDAISVTKGSTSVQVHAVTQRLEQAPSPFHKPLPLGPSVQFKRPSAAGVDKVDLPLKDRCQARLQMKASVSEVLDFHPENRSVAVNPSLRKEPENQTLHKDGNPARCVGTVNTCSSAFNETSFAQAKSPLALSERTYPLCILADSREISSGSEIISCLKTAHGVKVEVCSLSGCDYIVSNRMAVERKVQSEFANSNNRNKLIERMHHLQNSFERICLIVEKDRVKSGETSRLFQRTKYYDSMLSSLIAAGIRILFSSTQEETAGLLKELALVEQRKKVGILVPTEVKAHKQEALQFYLSIPNVNYITALNMCHRFDTVKQMTNSSVTEIASHAQISQQKAEEIYRYIYYVFDSQMLPQSSTSGKIK
ncbi:Fanconi anemia group M protein isoform X2 [Ambystoma mexicanum]|uniref:Fanconi anemia group M protein isoform X2 n=1 Tax=Ambystoma mexicanum TaxID=8296 RepID=UPI0037E785FD